MKRIKINDIFRKIVVAILSVITMTGVVFASERNKVSVENQQNERELKEEVEAEAMLQSILNRYVAWENAEFNGRIRLNTGLPVTPTIKLYIERDKLIQLSIRAPFLGELGRVELTPTSILVVNKHNRNYCQETGSNLMNSYPGLIGDIQSLLLGRIVLLGEGELNAENIENVILQKTDDGEWILLPKTTSENMKIAYGYLVMSNGRTESLYCTMDGRPESILLQYSYPNSGMALNINVTTEAKQVNWTLDFNTVRWGGTPMSPINLNSYQKLSIREFVKAFKL